MTDPKTRSRRWLAFALASALAVIGTAATAAVVLVAVAGWYVACEPYGQYFIEPRGNTPAFCESLPG